MPEFYGESNAGPWLSARYLWAYGCDTQRAKAFHGKDVYISTDRGLWGPDSCGYTGDASEAGRYKFEDALDTMRHLGPEKRAKVILCKPIEPRTYLVKVSATLEIAASDPNEASETAELLTAPLTVPRGTLFIGVPQLENEEDI